MARSSAALQSATPPAAEPASPTPSTSLDTNLRESKELQGRIQLGERTIAETTRLVDDLRVELGRRLIEARPEFPRSGPRAAGWGAHVAAIGISQDTALNYMKLAGYVESSPEVLREKSVGHAYRDLGIGARKTPDGNAAPAAPPCEPASTPTVANGSPLPGFEDDEPECRDRPVGQRAIVEPASEPQSSVLPDAIKLPAEALIAALHEHAERVTPAALKLVRRAITVAFNRSVGRSQDAATRRPAAPQSAPVAEGAVPAPAEAVGVTQEPPRTEQPPGIAAWPTFEASTADLRRAADLLSRVVDRHPIRERQKCLRVQTEGDGRLAITATDHTVWATVRLGARIDESGHCMFEARNLRRVARVLPGPRVTLGPGGRVHAELRSGAASYKVVGEPDEEFPVASDYESVMLHPIDGAVLLEMINTTFYAASRDECRQHLHGVLLKCDGAGESARATMVGCDGHRFSMIERTLPGMPSVPRVTLPGKAVALLKRVLPSAREPVEIGFDDTHVMVRMGTLTVVARLVERAFPPFEEVVPRSYEREFTANRRDWLIALKQVSLMLGDNEEGVALRLADDCLQLTSSNPDSGASTAALSIAYSGGPFSISFNPKYLIEFLSHVDAEEVRCGLNSPMDSCVLRPVGDDGVHYVAMPMQLSAAAPSVPLQHLHEETIPVSLDSDLSTMASAGEA